MEIKLFKKILNDVFLGKGFSKKGSYYYREGGDCICVVGIQKSDFSTGYYINVGFILKGLHEISDKLKDTDGDIRTRLTHISEGKRVNFFDLEKLSDSDERVVKESVVQNVNEIIEPALKPGGIKVLLKERPVLLYQTTASAKEFLGIDIS